ncbi:hypothetical protein NDU88_007235 [Pleurodeles waltl]|uniref:Uncharacterized protein n=1 Tax=Pleurodeles waltl TaxID=8319 RepID=A0AAV7U0W8_PLEWA|nr:hypothetical protein NDU88_007235 [Pleurodeles waltl]
MDDGLRALRPLKTRDADVGGTEGGKRKETVYEETPTEEQTTTGPDDTATRQEGPKELERRHVPVGTWLTQSRPWDGVCSRELNSPATSDRKPGAECRSTDPCGLENYDIGNPDGRIPENIPARCRDEETIAEAGNPDIRVPDSVKMDDVLCALRPLKTRDADVGGTEGGKRKETVHEETPTEVQTTTGPEDTAMG